MVQTAKEFVVMKEHLSQIKIKPVLPPGTD